MNFSNYVFRMEIRFHTGKFQSFFYYSGFLAVLRRRGDLSHRGPLVILVIWIALALLSCIWLRSSILKFRHDSSHDYTNDLILVCLHSTYFLTLLLRGSSTYVQRRADDDVMIQF